MQPRDPQRRIENPAAHDAGDARLRHGGHLRTVMGEPSWRLSHGAVDLSLTVRGGMMAPVGFTLPDGRTVFPYYVNPWWAEAAVIEPPVLAPLRGDFFCLPFGAPNERGDERHVPHGAAASYAWTLTDGSSSRIAAEITYEGGGTITKHLEIADGTAAVMTRHVVTGFAGRYPLGHHATLQGARAHDDPARPVWRIMTHPFDLGMTEPSYTSPAADGEYYALAAGAQFESLEAVPTKWRDEPVADCSRFPARAGFIDILAWYRRTPDAAGDGANVPAWTVAVNLAEGYLWYSLKDARVLPATVMWIENRGRHGAPWNGRNSCLGLEETCSYFASGLAAPEDGGVVGAVGIRTAHDLTLNRALEVRTIQGVAAYPDPERTIVALEGGAGLTWAFVDERGGRYPLGLDAGWVLGGGYGKGV